MRHFRIEEFACPCCGRAEMDPLFLRMLDRARDRAGFPWIVTSGFRCQAHNAAVGGVADSAHLKGLAADIACGDGFKRFMIVTFAHWAGFDRMGIGRGFVHIDADPDKTARVLWMYKIRDDAIRKAAALDGQRSIENPIA